jgi:hypothetical protein
MKRNYSITEKDITKEKIATKFPVYKDVKKLWSYDFASEEKKRFRGELVWNPHVVSPLQVDEYLQQVY